MSYPSVRPSSAPITSPVSAPNQERHAPAWINKAAHMEVSPSNATKNRSSSRIDSGKAMPQARMATKVAWLENIHDLIDSQEIWMYDADARNQHHGGNQHANVVLRGHRSQNWQAQ